MLALAALSGAMLAGCTPEAPVETTPPPTPAEPTVSEEEALLEEAVAVAERVTAAADIGFATGSMPRDEMAEYASPDLIDELQAEAEVFFAQDVTLEGSSTLDSSELLPSDDPTIIYLLTCQDTSAVSVTDSQGEVISGGVERAERVFEFQRQGDQLIATRTSIPGDGSELEGCG